MKELLVLSGKGGTGKTTITGALAVLMENKVLADCDVDAADLHLILRPQNREEHEFWSGIEAHFDQERCTGCGTCATLCRFHAIAMQDGKAQPLPFSCEGCGVCAKFCPEGAITLADKLCGAWYIADTAHGPMVHARLGIGEENSGRLVALVKNKAREVAEAVRADWLLVDGPPGIGCPVIASLAGVTLVLLVTEPSRSGLHDLERVAQLAAHFKVPAVACLNKCDLEPGCAAEIERFCSGAQIPLLGRIPFDRAVVEAIVQGRSLLEHAADAPAALAVRELWEKLSRYAPETAPKKP
ncbi:MAG: ATP-binding protein [Thermodesulfobacteriota bacterium]